MSVDLLTRSHGQEIKAVFGSAKESILIISPFLGLNTCSHLANVVKEQNIKCRLITRFYREDFIQNANSIDGLRKLLTAGVEIFALIGLHSKLYIVDDYYSIVTSANYTYGGLYGNFELGIKIENEIEINNACIQYFNSLWKEIEIFNKENNNRAIITNEMLNEEEVIVNTASSTRTKNSTNFNKTKIGAELNNNIHDEIIELAINSTLATTDEGSFGAWLKFEADANNRHDPEIRYFSNDNKYIIDKTFFPTRPVGIKNGDKVFIALVSYDKDNVPTPVIVGRANTTGFKSSNVFDRSKKGWEYFMEIYPYYIELTNFEVISGPTKNGISLLDIYRKLKGKIYPSTFSENVTFEKIRQYHYQKDKIGITQYASNYIDSELDELFKKYGSEKAPI